MATMDTARLGETLNLLTNPHRRYVLYYLRTHSGAVSIDTLTAMLGNELEDAPATAGSSTSEQIEVTLRHADLPKLADAGLITFTQGRQSVKLDGINGHGQFIDEAAQIEGYAPPAASD